MYFAKIEIQETLPYLVPIQRLYQLIRGTRGPHQEFHDEEEKVLEIPEVRVVQNEVITEEDKKFKISRTEISNRGEKEEEKLDEYRNKSLLG
jgi:hypothetical protein